MATMCLDTSIVMDLQRQENGVYCQFNKILLAMILPDTVHHCQAFFHALLHHNEKSIGTSFLDRLDSHSFVLISKCRDLSSSGCARQHRDPPENGTH